MKKKNRVYMNILKEILSDKEQGRIVLGLFAIFLGLSIVAFLCLPDGGWGVLDKIGNILGLYTMILAFFTWLNVFRYRNKNKNRDRVINTDGGAVVVISICKDGKSIKNSVVNFCQNDPELKKYFDENAPSFKKETEFLDIPIEKEKCSICIPEANKKIVCLEYGSNNGKIKKDECSEFIRIFDDLISALAVNGITQMELFFAGPVAPAVFIGERIDNQITANIYQGTNGDYTFFGTTGREE